MIVKPVRCDVEEPKEPTAKYGLLLGGRSVGQPSRPVMIDNIIGRVDLGCSRDSTVNHSLSGVTVKTYNLFISHSWRHGNQYARIYRLLRNRRYFAFRDYSVPQHDPVHNAGNATQLRRAIRNQMAPCHAVLILAGVYAIRHL